MTFFEPIPSIEERALALPHMTAILESIAKGHDALHRSVPVYVIWRRIRLARDTKQRETHIGAAREAGFVEEIPSSGTVATRLRLTDKGYQAIGRTRPFWEDVA